MAVGFPRFRRRSLLVAAVVIALLLLVSFEFVCLRDLETHEGSASLEPHLSQLASGLNDLLFLLFRT